MQIVAISQLKYIDWQNRSKAILNQICFIQEAHLIQKNSLTKHQRMTNKIPYNGN